MSRPRSGGSAWRSTAAESPLQPHPISRLLIWEIRETAGFDTAWASRAETRLTAEGRVAALDPSGYWLSYRLQTDRDFVHRRMQVEARWPEGRATLDLRRGGGRWSANGEERRDLAAALDCDLGACPLTNTMPILRHGLHRQPGEHEFIMAFIEVPSLRVVAVRQTYTHVRLLDGGGAIVRYASGSFQSDLRVDVEGFVVDYPQLGRRVQPDAGIANGVRAREPGSVRPA